ncbi:MAG: EF-P beta-lysylation protein EpmB [Planctomycetia bacterium 21-64-5]|nr:MAG: EF-P beta-lysylation protein EpmB [Planctomycetia bacterium 21-64-5]HQU41792.1 EF-P beta-lysylation protein EpmB [Pirellulales bacterium]
MNESPSIPAASLSVGAEKANPAPSWQSLLKAAIRDPGELCRLLRLPDECRGAAVRAARDFPLFAPRGYVARMRPGDPRDPLLLQVLPLADELSSPPEFSADPVGDREAALTPGLLHKYQGRVLLVTTGACAVHCRYCFRRHFPYAETPHSLAQWEPAIEQIAADPTIDEVILSGGDPLTLVDRWLRQLAERLAGIGHVRRLRVHTRLPIVLPERVCPELLDWLRGTRLTPIVVVHANHPAEISGQVAVALSRMVDTGVVVLNQSVLLRRVNDNADVLEELCRRLVDLRVMPYYLHQLDRVRGAAHFEVPEAVGRKLVAELRRRLPGYAVPRYVRERAAAANKEPL